MQAPAGHVIQLHFDRFDTEEGFDTLTLYSDAGPALASTKLVTLSGTLHDVSDALNASSDAVSTAMGRRLWPDKQAQWVAPHTVVVVTGSLRVEWSTDGIYESTGWTISYHTGWLRASAYHASCQALVT